MRPALALSIRNDTLNKIIVVIVVVVLFLSRTLSCPRFGSASVDGAFPWVESCLRWSPCYSAVGAWRSCPACWPVGAPWQSCGSGVASRQGAGLPGRIRHNKLETIPARNEISFRNKFRYLSKHMVSFVGYWVPFLVAGTPLMFEVAKVTD